MKKTILAILGIALSYGIIMPASACLAGESVGSLPTVSGKAQLDSTLRVCSLSYLEDSFSVNAQADRRRPVAAIKTNLLFDLLSLVNLGVELPLGDRFSIAADICFPWWRIREKDITVQMPALSAELRYWFADRDRLPRMTGWFAGLQAAATCYDFQFGSLTGGRGVQGETIVPVALTVGYVQGINDALRIEYSLGLGYLRSDYIEYESVGNTAYGDIKVIPHPWTGRRVSGLLPSKASVSLVWSINKCHKK